MSATTPVEQTGVRTARRAGLRYASDGRRGIRRVRRGAGFGYVGPAGGAVRDPATLARIRSIAIPPAWTDVWVNPDPRGHVQATGRDLRRRKQSRYHARWREVRNAAKFGRMIAFGRALPRIRARVARDLGTTGALSRDQVLAIVVRLLETTLIRVGNDEYARANRSYGLTTLRDGHVTPAQGGVRLRFAGKGGKAHEVGVDDPRLARLVRRCQDLPGQRLFQYVGDDGRRRGVGSADVNAYLREASGEDFTAKDFRTWAGTVLALRHLGTAGVPKNAAASKRAVNAAIDEVAGHLRNTRAVCRSSYVHPAVFQAWEDRSLAGVLARRVGADRCPRGLRKEEAAALLFLVGRAKGEGRRPAAAA